MDVKEIEPHKVASKAKSISNWMLGDMSGLMNASNIDIIDLKITAQLLRQFTDLVESGTIGGPAAKEVFEEMFTSGSDPHEIAESRGLTQLNDKDFLGKAVSKVIGDNEQAVQDFVGGKDTAIKYLLGQVMKETRGRANPAIINNMLLENLKNKSQN